ncbi:MAG: YfhO family protein, partial [Nitrospinaceae bacterium]|nr:YfhO family protein [Nitrospinaceae bacterium]
LLDGFYPGWRATVDGKAVDILRGNHFFRTVALSGGEHRVVFDYVQKGFRTGAQISLGTLILLV